jgi:TPR repeat protein
MMHKLARVLFTSFMVTLGSGIVAAAQSPAWAGWAEAEAAARQGDFDTALREWRALAAQGDAKAAYDIGYCYQNGTGIPRDFAQALVWYQKSADQGDADGMVGLATIYSRGEGVPKDEEKALPWWRRAASLGQMQAQLWIAAHSIVLDDTPTAIIWAERSANQGYVRAQLKLGDIYLTGDGVPADYFLAYKWYSILLTQIPDSRMKEIAIFRRDQAKARITPEEIAKVEHLVAAWQPVKEGSDPADDHPAH